MDIKPPNNQEHQDDETPVTPATPGTVITPNAGIPPKSPAPAPVVSEADTAPAPPLPSQSSVSGEPPRSRRLATGALIAVLLLAVTGGVGLAYKLLFMKTAKPAVAEVKKDIADLRIGVVFGPVNTLYPTFDGTTTSFDVNSQIYEGLVAFDNFSKMKPLLADSWTNPDTKTWVFTLKHDVTFHNGKMLMASDVVHSFDLAKKGPVADAVTSTIDTITAVDDMHVKITTKTPDPLLLNRLVYMFIADDSVKPAAGTGAFMPDPHAVSDANHETLIAYDKYHQGRPSTRKISYSVLADDDSAVQAYKDGKIDIGYEIFDKALSALPDETHNVINVPSFTVAQLRLNANKAKSPLANQKVRQALYLATDAQAYADARGLKADLIGQLLPKEVPGYNPAVTHTPRDVAAAKQLLADAGYSKGLSLSFAYLTESQPAAEGLAKNWAEAGVTLKLTPYTDTDAFYSDIDAGKLEVVVDSFSSLLLDGSDVFHYMLQSKNYTNAEINKLIDQAASELDTAKRLQILQNISAKAAADVAVVPLYTRNVENIVSPKLHLSKNEIVTGTASYYWHAYQD